MFGTAGLRAHIMFPPMSAEMALASAEVIAHAKVLAIEPLVGNGVTQTWAKVISIEILTKGVSAENRISVFWNQHLADLCISSKPAPEVGQTYKVYLRTGIDRKRFEPVHPTWGFVEVDSADKQSENAFVEHTVKKGETLWGIAAHYYGSGARWRVLRVANFSKESEFEIYPLKPGMTLRIPTFPIKRGSQTIR